MAISPDFKVFELPSFAEGKLRVLIDPNQGEIGVWVVAEDAAGEAAPIKRSCEKPAIR